MPLFREKVAVILVASLDSVASHKRFKQAHGLLVTLLSDPEMKAIQANDVWKEKNELRQGHHGRGAHDLSNLRGRDHRPRF